LESPWFIYKPSINETMLDVMGHLNHARYLMLYEDARWQHFHDYGYTLEYMQTQQRGFVVIDAYITYQKEVKHREDISIRTRFLNMTKKVWTIEQEMLRPDGTQASTISLKAGVFDLKERRLTSADPEWLRTFWQKIESET
jgi:YbgC/YbaW family acyl-CoA thioester hydrolase